MDRTLDKPYLPRPKALFTYATRCHSYSGESPRLGTRGSLEEGHEGALPGTFLRGVFDHHDSAVTDLVKAPDWLSLAVVVNGVRLDVTWVRLFWSDRGGGGGCA